jgi:hypothetical protein
MYEPSKPHPLPLIRITATKPYTFWRTLSPVDKEKEIEAL